MTTADYNVLSKLVFLYLKYMEKYVLHNICHNSRESFILYIFVHIVYIPPHVPYGLNMLNEII